MRSIIIGVGVSLTIEKPNLVLFEDTSQRARGRLGLGAFVAGTISHSQGEKGVSDLIDVLSSSGSRTGEILSRKEVHRLGKYHRAVHLYLFNSRNEILLQKRSLIVDNYPGFFSISVLGHVNAGEYSSAAVKREVEEELGIDASKLKFDFLFSFFQEAILNETYIDRQFNDVYVTYANIDPNLVKSDPSEVSEIKFVSFESFRKVVSNESSGLAPVYAYECRDLVYFLGTALESKVHA